MKEEDLDILSLLVPMEGKTSGTMLGALEVTGLLPDVKLQGFLSVKDGEFQPQVLKKPVTGFNALVKFADEKIFLKNIRGKMGQGGFAIGGEIDMAGSSIKHMDIKAGGSDMAIVAKEYFAGLADMDLSLEGDGSRQTLRGTITTKNSTLRIPTRDLMRDPEEMARIIEEIKKSIPLQLRNTQVKVGLNLETDTWLTFLASSFLTRGSLAIMGQVPELAVVGEVDLYRGTLNLPLFDTPFKVYQGKAYFDGHGWSPYLTMDAEAQLGQYTIFADLSGKLESPKVEFTSDPPIQNYEIEKVLTGTVNSGFFLGGTLQTEGAAARLAERLVDLNLIQPLTHALGRTFGLTDVSLESSYLGSYSIKLAKALDQKERVLLTYEQVMMLSGQRYTRLYGIEYRLPRGMLLRLSNDDLGNSYFWIQARYSF
jgi:autotransporter translocation and assembly factor TamB